ncbi:hypothetical protein BJ138DRAFT_1187678 [Hygrophoropsis aurantiaca]|uniref:Uncharacterized protein n=1 Tax=Hygrophoropsis aurantiaca TaxID=72124 RepID=A0ACB7ZS22_9AGAM|nr:hypothetical protein BJ138DRAFT_1187678 [Hygrophoropsis aurantiaca]
MSRQPPGGIYSHDTLPPWMTGYLSTLPHSELEHYTIFDSGDDVELSYDPPTVGSRPASYASHSYSPGSPSPTTTPKNSQPATPETIKHRLNAPLKYQVSFHAQSSEASPELSGSAKINSTASLNASETHRAVSSQTGVRKDEVFIELFKLMKTVLATGLFATTQCTVSAADAATTKTAQTTTRIQQLPMQRIQQTTAEEEATLPHPQRSALGR